MGSVALEVRCLMGGILVTFDIDLLDVDGTEGLLRDDNLCEYIVSGLICFK